MEKQEVEGELQFVEDAGVVVGHESWYWNERGAVRYKYYWGEG